MKQILIILTLFLTACSVKEYEHTESKIIIIKTKKFKFADLGYVRNSDKDLQLELFVAGKSIKKIDINHLICVDEGCMSKNCFNEEYLDSAYPSEILQNILLGTGIYDGKNIIQTEFGFEQKIKTDDVDIVYTVGAKRIYFKDKKNAILIKIKELIYH